MNGLVAGYWPPGIWDTVGYHANVSADIPLVFIEFPMFYVDEN